MTKYPVLNYHIKFFLCYEFGVNRILLTPKRRTEGKYKEPTVHEHYHCPFVAKNP